MDNVKQNDWIALNLLNEGLNIDKLISDGINSSNTGIRPKEDYVQLKTIQDTFTDDSGTFNQALFDDFYNKQLEAFTQFSSIDQNKFLMDTFEYDPLNIDKKAESKLRTSNYEIKKVPNPFETSSYFHNREEGPRALSIAELAQKNKYFDNKTGKWSDKSPNELGALGTLLENTLAIAQWDEDGVHKDSNGNEVKHSKGDFKLNPEGKFYYETLDGKESYDRQVLGVLDVLTTDGSALNKIDIFDIDDIEISPVKSVARTIAIAAPYLIPGIGTYWAGLTASLAFAEAMPALFKTFGGLLDPDYSPSKGLNNFENFTKKFTSTQSEYNQEHSWSFDNIMQFASTSASQLFQQRWIAQIPKMLGMDKRVEAGVQALQKGLIEDAAKKGLIDKNRIRQATEIFEKTGKMDAQLATIIESMPEYKKAWDIYNKYQKTSTALARTYLVVTAASNTYGDALTTGFDRQTASLISAATYTGFYTLFNHDYFKSYLLTGTDLGEEATQLRSLVYNYLKGRGKEELGEAAAKKGAIGVFNKFKDRINQLWTDVVYGGRRNIATSALSEATEETIEEVMQDAAKSIVGNGFVALKKQLGYEGQGNYEWSKSDPFQRYLLSFVGGGVGGGIFGLENAIRNRNGANSWNSIISNMPEMQRQILSKVNSGQKDDLIKIANSFRGKVLGSNVLSYDERGENGEYLPTKDVNKTQNAYLIDSFINHVNALDAFLEQEGIKYSDGDLENIPIYRSLTALDISRAANDNKGLLDLMSHDLGQLQLKLNDLNSELKNLEKDEKTDPEIIEAVRNQFNYIKNKINKLVTGGDETYFGRLMTAYIPSVFTFYSSNIENFAKNVFNVDYNTASDALKAHIDAQYKKYTESGQSEIDAYNSYELYTKMSKAISEPINGINSPTSGKVALFYGSDEYLDIISDPLLGIVRYNDSASAGEGLFDYATVVKDVKERLMGTGLDSNLKLVYHIANYIFTRLAHNKELLPSFLNLLPSNKEVDDYSQLILSTKIGDDPIISKEFEEGYYNAFEQLVHNVIKSIVISHEAKALDENQPISHQKISEIIAEEFSKIDDLSYSGYLIEYLYENDPKIDDIIAKLGLDTFKFIDEEIIKCQNAKQTYTLEAPVKDRLKTTKLQLKQLRSLIKGATSITRSVDNLTSVNEVINDFNKQHTNVVLPLPVISANLSALLKNKLNLIESKIYALETISSANAVNENLREQKLSISIKQDRIKSLSKLAKTSVEFLNKNGIPLLPEFESAGDNENVDTSSLTQDNIESVDSELEQVMLNNEIKLHNYYKSLTNEQKDKFIDLLIQTYENYGLEPAYLSLDTEANSDSQHHSDALDFWYIATNLIASPEVFYKPYKEVILNDEFKKAPFYSQELIARQAIQFLNGNHEEKVRILSIVGAKFPKDPKYGIWSPLINTFRFSAGAGVGKTAAIIPLIQLVQNRINSNKYLYTAPTESHLLKLSEESGNKYTIEKLFKIISEELKIIEKGKNEQINYDSSEINKYLKLDGNSLTFDFDKYDLSISEGLKDLFGKNSILFIDEGTYVSKEQYIILDELASKIGFEIITTGDVLQAGVEGKDGDKNSFNKCLTFIGPSLYESKRVTTNIGKWNSSVLSKLPYNKKPKTFTLQYAINPENNDLVGIRRQEKALTQEDLNEFASLHSDSTIALYNVNSSGLVTPKNVEIFDNISKIQGKEFDYVIINGDLILEDEQQINSETRLNTILTRARKGTIVYGKIVNNRLDHIELDKKNWNEVFEININDESVKTYQQYRKNTISKIKIPDSEVEQPTEPVNEDLPETTPTEQLSEKDIPEIRAIVRAHTFYNRFGGVIGDNEVYHKGNDVEDLNIFLTEDVDIRSDIFRNAAIKYNALKNNLLYKLSGKSYKLEGIDDGGEFLIKVSKFDPNTDLTWGKGNFDESKDLSKSKYFKRLVYKAGDKEITLLIFPNQETIKQGENVQGNIEVLNAINALRAENDNPTYYKFDPDKLKFFTPDNPVLFDPINGNFENKRFWKKYQWRQGPQDYEYSFFTSSLPVRFSSEWLQTKYGDLSIKELYDQLDNFYKRCSEKWDSLGLPNNPFKQRNSLSPKRISRITPSQFTIFVKLRDNYNNNHLSLDEALSQYVSDLKQAHQIMQEITTTLENSEVITSEIAERLSRKARIRQNIQHIGLVYNYSPNPEWEDKFKSDLLLLGTKASHNKLDDNIRAWIYRIRTIQSNITDKPEWIDNINSADLEGILERISVISDGQPAFIADDSTHKHYMDVLWNIYNNIYKNKKEFDELVSKADSTLKPLNAGVFANVDQTNYNKNARIQLIPENIPYEQNSRFIYERGWSLMSFHDYGEGINSIFTPYNSEVTQDPDVTENVAEEIKTEILPENDLLTEECMDLFDEQNDLVKGFVNFVRSENNGIFVTSNDLNSADKKTFKVQIGNRSQSYTFSTIIASKIEAYMQSKELVFNKTKNQNLFLGGINSFLNILNAGEEC